jgi:hypothetical protein
VDILIREGVRVTGQIAALKVRTGVLPQIIMESGSLILWRHDPVSMSGAWMTAAGLAMRRLDARSDAGDVYLLPGDVTQVRSLVKHMLITATVAALVFLGMISSLRQTRAADAKRDRLDRQRFTEQLYLTPRLGPNPCRRSAKREWSGNCGRSRRRWRRPMAPLVAGSDGCGGEPPAGVQFMRLSSQTGNGSLSADWPRGQRSNA